MRLSSAKGVKASIQAKVTSRFERFSLQRIRLAFSPHYDDKQFEDKWHLSASRVFTFQVYFSQRIDEFACACVCVCPLEILLYT